MYACEFFCYANAYNLFLVLHSADNYFYIILISIKSTSIDAPLYCNKLCIFFYYSKKLNISFSMTPTM